MFQATKKWLSRSIKRQVVLVFAVAGVLYSLVYWQVKQQILLPQFEALQETEAREDVQRCVSVIEHEIRMTSRKAADWAAWDDTCKFVEDLNSEYAQSNLVDDAFISLQVDVMVFCDPNGRVAWQRVFDWRNEKDMSLAEFNVPSLGMDHELLQHSSTDSVIEGIHQTEHLPLLLSSMPIITSEREGPIRGTLIMGMFLDQAMINRWSNDLSIDFGIKPINDVQELERVQTVLEHVVLQGSHLHTCPKSGVIHGTGLLHNVHGDPLLLVQVNTPPEILAQGRSTLRFASMFILVAGAILLAAVYATLNRTLLGRLYGFSRNFREIADGKDLTYRVEVSEGDEMSVLQDGLNSMLHSLEESAEHLRESEATYRQIFKAVQDCLCVLDPEGKIIAANPSACDLFGATPESLAGKPGSHFIHDEDCHLFNDLLKQTVANKKHTQEMRFLCANQEVVKFCARARMTRMQGKPYVLMVLRDVAEHRQIESSLREAQQEVESASQIKSGLLRNVTHEMRTPLHRIIGFSEILHDEPLKPELKDYIDNIKQSGEELRDLINSIIDVSRIEAGTINLNVLPCSLTALTHELKTIGGTRAATKKLQFEVSCDKDLPENLETDVDRLRQCLLYLVDNAIKFTDQGYVRLHISKDQDNIRFAVEDSGPGITQEQQAVIFRPFEQGDGSSTRTHGGLGTGLAIAKRLTELLEGTLSLETVVGQGSTFYLVIPSLSSRLN